jgi:hypothetical protein
MGTLTFQAALGGSVNLLGPNTASNINFTLPSADGTSGQPLQTNGSGTLSFANLAIANGGTGATSFTANQIHYGSFSQSAGLTFDGTNFATTGTATATKLIPTGTSVTGNGMYLPATNSLGFSTTGAEAMRIDSSGRLLVNSTSDVGGNNPVFSVNAGSASTFANIMEARWTGTVTIYHLLVRNGNGLLGGVTSNGSTVAYTGTSDYRLKENITPITGALTKVAALKPVTYKWKIDGTDGEGFIAHELAEVCPIAVYGEKDAVNEDGSIKSQSIDTSFLIATLTAAIQEQQALITTLTARIEALEAK